MRLLFVQFGDYKEAFYRFLNQGKETYYAQKYTVDWVAKQAKQAEHVTVLCVATDNYEETLPNQVHVVGMNAYKEGQKAVIHEIEKIDPTHLICCFPSREILKWSIKNNVRTLPLLADSFELKGLRNKYKNFQLKKILNHPHFDWIANHNINASLSLKNIGVELQKIIPWDYPPMITPDSFSPKKPLFSSNHCSLFYAGNLIVSKGLGDGLEAIKKLKQKGLDVSLTIAGPGDFTPFKKKITQLNIDHSIYFLGKIGHDQVIEEMVKHDIILVPSWHEYPEGLPMTIYEALCSHTPLVISDHPMFLGKIEHEKTGMIFRSKDPEDLAKMIEKLMKTPHLYEKISKNSKKAWLKIQIPVKWDQLLTRWLSNTLEDQKWQKQNNLSHIEKLMQ